MGAANDEVVAPTESMTAGVSQPQQAGNVAPAADEPGNAAARAALAAETPGFAIPETRGEQEPPQRASSLRVSESGTVAATKLHRPENDPLAALYGMSEEELIALFC
jgi:hypothetical protein